MAKSDSKSSVRKEQFGNTEITKKNPSDNQALLDEASRAKADSVVKVTKKNKSPLVGEDEKETVKAIKTRKKKSVSAKALPKKKKAQAKRAIKVPVSESVSAKALPKKKKAQAKRAIKVPVSESVSAKALPKKKKVQAKRAIKVPVSELEVKDPQPIVDDKKKPEDEDNITYQLTQAEIIDYTNKPVEESEVEIEDKIKFDDQHGEGNHDHIKQSSKYQIEKIEYAKLSKEDLVKVLKDLLNKQNVNEIRRDVDAIKSNFYKRHKTEIEEIRKKFIDGGGQPQDFKIEENPMEAELKELLVKYRDSRNGFNKHLETEKVKNLAEKYKIIDAIKELVNCQESLNKTFQEFRELQNRWREVGPVPQQNLKVLWESYHYQVEAFYDYIKINKELRDLDLRKNLEIKMKLCEKAEELLLEPSIVEAFRKLQALHEQWREIGPVPIEKRSEIWERFKEATTKINRKHQEYFVNLKQDQKKNYEEKLMLCEKVEEIALLEIDNHKEWEDKSKELIELQKVWKTIGFAPKKYNTQVYDRFRKACDEFFEKKRAYYALNREEQQNNLQLKTELCIQAEAMQNSTDWKKTMDELIALQKKWKEIGPVSAKISDRIWKRFRAACDKFFENKSKFYSHIDTSYEENLLKKLALIEEIEKLELNSDVESNLNTLKDFQRNWSEIGYVPIKQKKEIQERYRKVINTKFDQLKLDENKKSSLKFRSRLENIIEKPNSQHRLHIERDKCFNRLKQLENDMTLWENNIGFFANSKNAESLIADVNNKIENAKRKIQELKDRIKILDELED
jgi:hypothetical protein